jgi:amidase
MIGTQGERAVTDLGAEFVVTRSVRDAAAILAACEDTTPGRQLPPVGLVAGPGRRRLRVGLVIEGVAGNAPDPQVVAATEDTAKLLSALGHHVEPTSWPIGPELIQDFLLVWGAGALDLTRGVARAFGRPADASLLEPFTLALAERAAKVAPETVRAAVDHLSAHAVAYEPWFDGHQFDVVISPVVAAPPPPLGYVGPNVAFDTLIERLIGYVGYTPYHNVVGAPAMSVPLHWSEDGLPIGTQVFARVGGERLLLEVAYQLEAARPWAQRAPPVRA